MPESFFKSFIAKKPSAIIFPNLFMEGNGESYVDFESKRYRLAMVGTISRLEKAFLECRDETGIAEKVRRGSIERGIAFLESELRHLPKEYIQLAEFVMQAKSPSSKCSSIAESILPSRSFFILGNSVYPLFESGHNAVIERKQYTLGLRPCFSINELEGKYQKAIEAEKRKQGIGAKLFALEALKQGCWFDENKNIGFKIIKERFYAYTKVNPYILFERMNECYYSFPAAEVGIPLFLNANGIDFGKLYVLGKYSHPSLPSLGIEMQPICAGSYDYDAVKRRHSSSYAVLEELMEKARNVLTTEYKSRGKPYYFLTNHNFNSMKVSYFDKSKVTNIG